MWCINRIFVHPMVALILACLLWLFSDGFVFAQSCDALNNQPPNPSWVDSNGLLPHSHNPASVPPKNNPSAIDEKELVPSVPMTSETCTAIRLFDASADSERHYDLVNCLDGLTFGFGNWPQSDLGDFFKQLSEDSNAEKALVGRFVEVFKGDSSAWSAFRGDAGLAGTVVDEATVRTGIKNLLVSAKIKNVRGLKNSASDGTCVGQPANGTSFYFDHAKWLVPALEYAFRDTAVVAFQVNFWEADVMSKAKSYAKALGLPAEGVFLMAFYESNPGQVPSLKTAISRQRPPETLHAGGQDWKWDGTNRPSALAGITLDKWHTLLLWQAMCPDSNGNIRIRNRNLKFFSEYLAADFKVPTETQTGMPSAKDPKNCNPTLVKIR